MQICLFYTQHYIIPLQWNDFLFFRDRKAHDRMWGESCILHFYIILSSTILLQNDERSITYYYASLYYSVSQESLKTVLCFHFYYFTYFC